MAPVAVALVAFSLSAWTFDTKLSLTGDNTEFITLARSLAQGEKVQLFGGGICSNVSYNANPGRVAYSELQCVRK